MRSAVIADRSRGEVVAHDEERVISTSHYIDRSDQAGGGSGILLRMKWREQNGVRWLEAELSGATAAFTTRLGGVSCGPYASLNLGVGSGDMTDAVRDNRVRLAATLELEAERIVLGAQVHGAEIGDSERPSVAMYTDPSSDLPQLDGQVVRGAGMAGLVLVADCLPVVVAGPEGVAVLHCGWRGLAAGIVERGADAVGATSAAVGPGIGPCCYEVGPEVGELFSRLGADVWAEGMLDLPGVAARLLGEAGVSSIEHADMCTKCNPDLFFSYRRDKPHTGRQAGVAWISEPAGVS